MKKILSISVAVLMLTATYAFAQTDSGMKSEQKGEMKRQGMKMDEEMMKQMMEKCQPMMKQMMDNGMMKKMMGDKKEMMQMMMEMMDMQEKMMKGPKAAEKKQMMNDMAQMKGKMRKMMSMPMDMAGMDDPQPAEPRRPIRINSRQQEDVIMSYYFSKTLNLGFDKVIAGVTEEL